MITAIELLREESEQAAETVRDELLGAIRELNNADLSAFASELSRAYQEGVRAAEDLAAINEEVLEEGFRRLGTTAAEALGRDIPTAGQEAIDVLDAIEIALHNAELSAEEFQQGMTAAFEAAIVKQDTLESLETLAERIREAGEAGTITVEAMQELERSLERQRGQIALLDPAVQALEAAYRQLGLTSPRALAETADRAREAYEIIRDSEQPVHAVRQAFTRYAEAAVRANGGVINSLVSSEAAALGLEVNVDEAGRVIVRSMAEAREAVRGLREETQGATDDFGAMATAAEEAADRIQKANESAPRQGRAWPDPSRIDDIDALQAAIQQARDHIRMLRSTSVRGDVIWQQQAVVDEYIASIQARIDELEEQSREAKRETELTREANQAREAQIRMPVPPSPAAPVATAGRSGGIEHLHIHAVDINDRAWLQALARNIRPYLADETRRAG